MTSGLVSLDTKSHLVDKTMTTTVFNGRVEWWAEHYKGEKYHALLCDPPYHLTPIVDRFGKPDSAPAQFGTDGAFARASRGFMGKTWDGGDIAFRPDTWRALTEHLHPGAFGMAFASSRGWHRMAVAIEDAGLIIHPTIFNWVFGSGFPKATRIDTQIDAAAGANRPVIGEGGSGNARGPRGTYGTFADETGKFPISAPAPSQARIWEGHRYGLQAMKPAVEPIILFQKPYVGRPVDCITRTGAGAINIDAARISGEWDRSTPWKNDIRGGNYVTSHGKTMEIDPQESHPLGRWPANFVLSTDAAIRLDTQSGVLESGSKDRSHNRTVPRLGHGGVYGNDLGTTVPREWPSDSGGASRFYHNYDWQLEVEEQLASADPVRYEAKASPSEREAGLNHLLPSKVGDGRHTPNDTPFLRDETERLNSHPTIKPIGLTEWLSKLLLPPKEYGPRRILVPFSGSGSEMIGAYRAGWEHVYGIEMTREYAEIARARLQYWRLQGVQLSLFDAA